MLNLKYTTERIIEKLKCYFANRISKYIEAKDYGFFCQRDKVKKELLELRRMIFLLENVEDCDLTGLERKVDELMATINNIKCLDDDCIKQSVIEKLIDDAINTALEDYTPTDDMPLLFAKVSVSNAKILNMGDSPVDLLPVPGAGKAYELYSANVRLTGNTVDPYEGDDSVVIKMDTVLSPWFREAGVLANADGLYRIQDLQISNSIAENDKVVMTTINGAGNNPTTGAGAVDVYLTYRIITL